MTKDQSKPVGAVLAGLGLRQRVVFLAKDSALYGSASALSKCFALFTFPILTRHFTTAEYGIIDLFGMVTSALVIVVMFGQDSAIRMGDV